MERTEPRTADTEESANGTHVTVSRESSDKEMTTIDGDQVRYDERQDTTTRTQGEWPAEADEHVRSLIRQAQMEREARENIRANHRNLNRMMTLIGALVIGLAVTFMLTQNGIPGLFNLPAWSHGLAPYAFVITILMDSGLALYGYIRHY
jgi:chemotaxis protein histidine kinase CheA